MLSNRKTFLGITSLTLVLVAIFIACIVNFNVESDRGTYHEKALKFTFTLKNNSADYIEATEFISQLPININNNQEVKEINSDAVFEVNTDDAENPYIVFKLNDLTPYSTKIINLTLLVNKSDAPISDDLKGDIYLKSEKYIEKESVNVKEVSSIIPWGAHAANDIYHWVSENVKDIGYVKENRGARYALEHRVGDCTEHMFLFVALARNKNISARGYAGFYVDKDISLMSSSLYHNWAEFYDGKNWIISDSHKKIFNNEYQNFIAYRMIGGSVENFKFTSRFMSVDPRISIEF